MNGVAIIGMANTSVRLAQGEAGLTMKPKNINLMGRWLMRGGSWDCTHLSSGLIMPQAGNPLVELANEELSSPVRHVCNFQDQPLTLGWHFQLLYEMPCRGQLNPCLRKLHLG